MKVQGSDIKTLADLGGDTSKQIQDNQIYVTGGGINDTLSSSITNKTFGSPNASIVNPTGNTYDLSAVANDSFIVHTQSNTCIYKLPSAAASAKHFTFQNRATQPNNNPGYSGNVINIDSTNNQVYWYRGSAKSCTLTNATGYSFSSFATEVQTRMNAADGGQSYACSFDSTRRCFVITNTNAFYMQFGTYTSNSSNILLGFAQEDTTSSITQTGYNIDQAVIIRPASGDIIRWRKDLVESPGYLMLMKRGMSVKLTSVDSTYWVVDKIVHENHEKHTTIGLQRDAALVGRDSWVTKAALTFARAYGRGFSINGYSYHAGGSDDSSTSYSNTDQYNDSANTWTAKAGTNYTDTRPWCGFALNGYGYIAGCWVGGTGYSYCSQYNDGTNVWASKGGINNGRDMGSGFSLNGYGYMADGYTGAALSYVDKYNDATNAWASAATTLHSVNLSTAFMLNGYGYCCCGGATSNADQYNDSTDIWIARAYTPTSYHYQPSFSLNGYGVIGIGNSSNVVQYNDSFNSWIYKNTFTGTTRGYAVGNTLNGYGYFSGGGGLSSEANQYN